MHSSKNFLWSLKMGPGNIQTSEHWLAMASFLQGMPSSIVAMIIPTLRVEWQDVFSTPLQHHIFVQVYRLAITPSICIHFVAPSPWLPSMLQSFLHGLWIRIPSFPVRKNAPLHSSYARPAPNPAPTKTGHALLLNSSTEKTTPKPTPREDRTRSEDRQRSHYITVNWTFAKSPNPIIWMDSMTSRRGAHLLVQQSFRHRLARAWGCGWSYRGVRHNYELLDMVLSIET